MTTPISMLSAGLLVFLIIIISRAGGLIDGSRRGFAQVALIWSSTALVSAVGMAAMIDLFYVPFDGEIFVANLRDLGAFSAGLILIPAILGGGLTAVVASTRTKVVH